MYYDDMISRFVSNYNQPYPVNIPGLGDVSISGGVTRAAARPTDSPWLRLSITPGADTILTLGTLETALTQEPFNVNVQIYLPRTTVTTPANKRFSRTIFSTIERHLDGFMKTNGFNASGESAVIRSASEPKFKIQIDGTEEETFDFQTITYQYNYRYF